MWELLPLTHGIFISDPLFMFRVPSLRKEYLMRSLILWLLGVPIVVIIFLNVFHLI